MSSSYDRTIPEPLPDGESRIFQPPKGYRFTTDPFLLCGHIHPGPQEKILDIGCGCGIMPLLLARKFPGLRITGVEIQKELAGFAMKNVKANHLSDVIRIINQDITELQKKDTQGPFDSIITNPPYKKAASGRVNPDLQKAIARHEIHVTISTLLGKADELLKPMGKMFIIFPAERISDLCQAMGNTRIRPAWIRFVHPSPQKNAIRIILCGIKYNKSACSVQPPLYLYDTKHNQTEEYKKMICA